jgi:invasion protein IalB
MWMRHGLLVLLALVWLAGCAASRTVTPTPMAQAGDEQLTCAQLMEQIAANRKEFAQMQRQDTEVGRANAAKVAAGSLLMPIGLLLAMSVDLSSEAQVRARSLVDRNDRLIALARSKGCTEP